MILVEVFTSELLELLLLLELMVEVNFYAVFFLHCFFLLFSVLLVPLTPAVLTYITIKKLYYLVLPLLQLFLPYYALLRLFSQLISPHGKPSIIGSALSIKGISILVKAILVLEELKILLVSHVFFFFAYCVILDACTGFIVTGGSVFTVAVELREI